MKNNKELVKYNNHRDEFLTPFSSFFDEVFEDMFPDTNDFFGVSLFSKGSYPKVDIRDEEKQLTIEAEIPGLTKDQVSVEVVNNVLTIKGEKKEKKEDEKKGEYVHRELKHSSFARSFSLNDNLEVDKINAKFENGVLTVTLPKKTPTPAPLVKRVEVK